MSGVTDGSGGKSQRLSTESLPSIRNEVWESPWSREKELVGFLLVNIVAPGDGEVFMPSAYEWPARGGGAGLASPRGFRGCVLSRRR
jgi:hypothetical protein